MEKFKIELRWGIYSATAYFVWLLLMDIMGFYDSKIPFEPTMNLVFIVPQFVLVYFAIKEKKIHLQSNMIWQQGFVSGIIIAVVFAFLTPMLNYFLFTYLKPDFFENAIALLTKKYPDKLTFAKNYYNIESYIYTTIFNILSIGTVVGAIVSYIHKNKN